MMSISVHKNYYFYQQSIRASSFSRIREHFFVIISVKHKVMRLCHYYILSFEICPSVYLWRKVFLTISDFFYDFDIIFLVRNLMRNFSHTLIKTTT